MYKNALVYAQILVTPSITSFPLSLSCNRGDVETRGGRSKHVASTESQNTRRFLNENEQGLW
ncbi:hypothetical protein BC937DRAFT_87942 [Endogone sp. FLAS-F59071]|nr:hypothetical protein BC937DRAFT_87942 [Endogone sp. FLAS-F59071]|eukprot:RUS19146.1 hypothetical protein BC937DRAFT_87942 [Endogone sp. FLAS-F59071]